MVDVRADSILDQSQEYFLELVEDLVDNKRLGKALEPKWDKANRILDYFEAYTTREMLEDPDILNYILECLIILAGLYNYPAAPTFNLPGPPQVIGIPGPKGDKGDKGDRGEDGGGTDVQVVLSNTGVVDSFPIESATGARWEYTVTRNTGEQRSGVVIGTWSTDGSNIDFFDNSTDDIVGTTTPLSFDVQFASGNIQLVAIITEGIWSIVLSRYFIPNNGSGTGPISDNLPHGLIYIGNTLNIATPRAVSGHVTITDTGTVTLANGVVLDTHINANAGIQMTKLEAMDPDEMVITNSLGFLTTQPITDVTGPLLTLINSKMTDPMTSIGDMVHRNGSNVTARLPIGSTGQVLTVAGGLPVWANPAGALPQVSVDMGDWNMDTTAAIFVDIAGLVPSKVRSIQGMVRSDVGSFLGEMYIPVAAYGTGNAAGARPVVHIGEVLPQGGTATRITVRREDGSFLDSVDFDATSYNRGWLVITYIP